MPYASNDDLPAEVRSKYAEKCQRAFRHAFNSVYGSTDGDEGRSFAAAHSAAQKCQGTPVSTSEEIRRIIAAKEWAHNNTAGKKGFQPKGTGASVDSGGSSSESSSDASLKNRVVLDEIDAKGIQMPSTFDRSSGFSNGMYPVNARAAGGKIGYARELVDPVMSGAIRVGSRNDGYEVRGVFGGPYGSSSTSTGAKAAIARQFNSGGPSGGRSVVHAYAMKPEAYRTKSPVHTIGFLGTNGPRSLYRVMREDGSSFEVFYNSATNVASMN
jgi:cation transport regulator ChaB